MYTELMNWCSKYNAFERTEKYFYRCFEGYKREEPEEFKAIFKYGFSDIRTSVSSILYRQHYPEDMGGLVCVILDIFRKKEKVGWYKMFYYYNDGSEFDDYFGVYEEFIPEQFK